MNDKELKAIRQRRAAAAGETVLHAGRVLADVDLLLAEVDDLRRQVADLEELLRREEARG